MRHGTFSSEKSESTLEHEGTGTSSGEDLAVLLHAGCVVEVAYELLGNLHVLTGLRAEGIYG